MAIISQSGGLLLEIANPLIERGVGLSHLLSTGNEAGTTLEGFADFLLDDPAITLLGAIVESFHHPRAIAGLLERAADKRKPLIVPRSAVRRRAVGPPRRTPVHSPRTIAWWRASSRRAERSVSTAPNS